MQRQQQAAAVTSRTVSEVMVGREPRAMAAASTATTERSEISKDVFLFTTTVEDPPSMTYELEVAKAIVTEFTMNFAGSENVR